MKTYKKYYQVVIGDKATIRELSSDLPFSVEEGKIMIRDKHPNLTSIKHVSKKEVQKLMQLVNKLL